MAKGIGLSCKAKDTPIHALTGASKLIMTLCFSISSMISFDTRFLVLVLAISLALFKVSGISLRDLKLIVTLMLSFLLINNIIIFLFSPEEGVAIYSSRHDITHLFGGYFLTQEQLFYQLNVTLKYFCIMPVALIFFATTEPSEFASSLNSLGASYKMAYAVSLALRYIPDIQRSYTDISQAQQARGVDISRRASLPKRLKGILHPLPSHLLKHRQVRHHRKRHGAEGVRKREEKNLVLETPLLTLGLGFDCGKRSACTIGDSSVEA
jgi:energy-coupling factor transport system permease protein